MTSPQEHADQLREKADAMSEAASAKYERFAGGQPLLVGHHSYRSALRDRNRADNATRRAIQASEDAKRAQGKANGARIEAELAAVVAAQARPWQRSDFQPGDIVSVRSHISLTDLYRVKRVNAKTLTLEGPGGGMDDPKRTYDRVLSRTRDGITTTSPDVPDATPPADATQETAINDTDPYTPAIGDPVVILEGLPYEVTWDEGDDRLAGLEGVITGILGTQWPAPYQVTLPDGRTVCTAQVRLIAEPVATAPPAAPDAGTSPEPAQEGPRARLVTIDLPDYLTAPVARHAVLPMDTDRSALARRARAYVAQAADVLIAGGAQLAGYTASGHCVTEGAHLELRTFHRQDHADVVLDLALTHFNNRQNPVDHPRYAALRAARVAETNRWADLFRTAGWDVQEAHNTTPGRLAFILTPPTGP